MFCLRLKYQDLFSGIARFLVPKARSEIGARFPDFSAQISLIVNPKQFQVIFKCEEQKIIIKKKDPQFIFVHFLFYSLSLQVPMTLYTYSCTNLNSSYKYVPNCWSIIFYYFLGRFQCPLKWHPGNLSPPLPPSYATGPIAEKKAN